MTAHSLDHIAVAVARWVDGAQALSLLRGSWCGGWRLPAFQPCQVEFAAGMRVELLAPGEDSGNFVARFLDRRLGRNGPHHITFKVDDIHDTLRTAEAQGFTPLQVRLDQPAWREGFLHPKETGLGFLVQFVESDLRAGDPGTGAALPCPWSTPEGTPAGVDGIVVEVADPVLAHRVLHGVLGGTRASRRSAGRPECATYRWAGGAALHTLPAAGPAKVGVLVLDEAPPAELEPVQDAGGLWITPVLEPLGLRLAGWA
ncbi:VOC family protein [Streptomyces sp. NPDC055037]